MDVKRMLMGILAVGFAVLVPAGALQAQGNAEQLLREGKDLCLQGNHEEAIKKFEEVMRLKPASEEALKLREMAGVEFLVDLLTRKGKLANFAEWLLSRAEASDEPRKSNPELIDEILQDLMSDDMRRYQWALERIAFEVGEYAVPKLSQMLGDENNALARERAVIALTRMGSQATLPVIECLNSQNTRLKQGAVIVLGHLSDLRAVADLKRLYEDPKESSEVKGFVEEGLKNLTGRAPEKLRPAREYYYNKAMLYYQNHPAVIRNYERNWLFWKWNEEKGELEVENVPQWLYNFRLAEEACYDALDMDYTYVSMWAILALVDLAEYNEALVHLQSAPEAVKDKLQELSDRNYQGWVGGLGIGQAALFDALDLALRNNDATVAVSVIRALAETADHTYFKPAGTAPPPGMTGGSAAVARPPAEGAPAVEAKEHPLLLPGALGEAKAGYREFWPLHSALTYPDKRVRYAAASAFVKIHNRSAFLRKNIFAGVERVVEVLIEALGESGARAILVASPDSQSRNDLVSELGRMDYFAFGSDTPASAIQRALRFPSEDLVVLDMDLANTLIFHASVGDVEKKETVIDALRADYRTTEVPIVILCEESKLERAKELFGQDAKEYITTPMNFSEIKIKLAQIFANFPMDDKAMATRIAREAAEAVESLDPWFTSFPVNPEDRANAKALGDLVAALVAVIEKRADEVRTPALRALGKIASAEVVPAITNLIKAKDANSPEIRAVAARALGEIVLRANAPVGGAAARKFELPPETLDSLLEGVSRDEASAAVRAACSEALGKADVRPEERFKGMTRSRVNPRK
jgi:HEAT repeat protein